MLFCGTNATQHQRKNDDPTNQTTKNESFGSKVESHCEAVTEEEKNYGADGSANYSAQYDLSCGRFTSFGTSRDRSQKKHPTVELTRRRESKHPSTHQAS